ncbi:hypothetical protein V6C27_02740 [Peptococcaceae bacterium 1198_IL3148]
MDAARIEQLKAMLDEKGIKWPKGISYSETFEPDREREVKALRIVKAMPTPSERAAQKEVG